MTAVPLAAMLRQAATLGENELDDWGAVAEPLGSPVARTSGRLLTGGGGRFPEAGIWRCSTGRWRLALDRAEFCHFLQGACTYVSDGGETIEVAGGDSVWFPAGWRGRCEVVATVAKAYVVL